MGLKKFLNLDLVLFHMLSHHYAFLFPLELTGNVALLIGHKITLLQYSWIKWKLNDMCLTTY